MVRFPVGAGNKFPSPPPCPDRLWGLHSIIFNAFRGLFPWGYSSRNVSLTTLLCLVQKLKMHGAVPRLNRGFREWCLIKHRKNFPFYLAGYRYENDHSVCFCNTVGGHFFCHILYTEILLRNRAPRCFWSLRNVLGTELVKSDFTAWSMCAINFFLSCTGWGRLPKQRTSGSHPPPPCPWRPSFYFGRYRTRSVATLATLRALMAYIFCSLLHSDCNPVANFGTVCNRWDA